MRTKCAFLFSIALLVCSARALKNGLAITPPMGWLTWQRFRCNIDCETYPDDCISERLIKRTIDRMTGEEWQKAGYKYVIIDDCWSAKQRNDTTNELVPDPVRFPNSMKSLASYAHDRGLLLGIYLDYGTYTCQGYPGSMEYLRIDAQTMASWDVDYIKMDGCNSPLDRMPGGYEQFAMELNRTKRPMIFSCSYPAYIAWQQNYSLIDWNRLVKNCNLWRMLGDIQDSWNSVVAIINSYKRHNKLLYSIAGPGHFNDPDMLLLGNFGLSRDQQRVQMGMWCMFAAPLLMSVDMDNIDLYSAELLRNPRLIEINQDVGGHQARFITERSNVQFWSRKLENQPDSWAIAAFYNSQGGGPIQLQVDLAQFNITSETEVDASFKLVDTFNGSVIGLFRLKDKFVLTINPSGIMLYHAQQLSGVAYFRILFQFSQHTREKSAILWNH